MVLLGGHDKASDPSAKRQKKEIETARARLRKFLQAQRKAAKAEKKGRD